VTTLPQPGSPRRSRNPFCHSDKTLRETTQPLRPHEEVDDGDYIVDIDHTGECYAEFERAVTVRSVRKDGGLVLAVGEKGWGKTTLLYRCANGMKVRAETAGCLPLIIDLEGQKRNTERLAVAARARTLYRSVINSLRDRQLLKPEELDELLAQVVPSDTADDQQLPPDVYLRLSQVLGRQAEMNLQRRPADIVLIIVLPPFQEVPAEIEFYQRQLAPRLLFLCETQYTPARLTGHETTVLPLGRIDQDDVWKVAEQRLSRNCAPDCPPYTTRDDVVDYFRGWSLGFAAAQHVLLRAFEDALASQPSPERLGFRHFDRALQRIVLPEMIGRTP
jgi:hypothetical protein